MNVCVQLWSSVLTLASCWNYYHCLLSTMQGLLHHFMEAPPPSMGINIVPFTAPPLPILQLRKSSETRRALLKAWAAGLLQSRV